MGTISAGAPAPVIPGNPLPALTEVLDLIDPDKKVLLPVDIPIIHPQLRHYISVVEDGTIYYATGNEIFTIRDDKRRLAAWVDFKIQCLAAAHGWLCVGGPEKGRIAFRHFALDDTAASRETDADRYHASDLRSVIRSGSPEGLRYLPQSHSRTVQATGSSGGPRPIFYKNIGSDIVNAITIQKIVPKHKDAEPEVVALLANNDRTITVFSLDQMEVLKILTFEESMNHASITRDGSLLIACGDINKAYFFAGREIRRDPGTGRIEFDWDLLAQPYLAGFPDKDPCFSTAFSPDEDFCTFASQSGMLAKYEVGLIQEDMAEDEAIVQAYCSSRPGTHLSSTFRWCGAVGSVAFSPRPLRLLAWAEAKGRVCIADLELPNRPPQVVELLRNDPTTIRADFPDTNSPDGIDIDESFSHTLQRLGLSHLREGQNRATSVNAAADNIEDAVSRQRRLQQSLSRLIERGVSPFPEQRSEQQQRGEQQRRLSEFRQEGGWWDMESRAIPHPRRRSSVILSHTNNATSATSSSHPSSLAPILPATSTLSASPSRMASNEASASPSLTSVSRPVSGSDIHEAWQTISNAMANAPQESRQALLQQNLRTLRETRASLDRFYQLARDSDLRPGQQELGRDPDGFLDLGAFSSTGNENSTPPTRRSASVSRLRRSAVADASLRNALEDSINESQDRLRLLERDLDQINRDHTFYARATRMWQDSESSNPRPAGSNATNEDTTTEARLRHARERHEMMQRLFNHPNGSGYVSLSGGSGGGLYDIDNGMNLADDEVGIMGVAWSNTAEFLYVATTHGIYKLTVNGVNHKTFPAPAMPL